MYLGSLNVPARKSSGSSGLSEESDPQIKRFTARYFPGDDFVRHTLPLKNNLWSNGPLSSSSTISRKEILSQSLDRLNYHLEEDVWFQAEKLFQDHIEEVLSKWPKIDDEIWSKIILMERNKRVAKMYARAPVLAINGSDDGFDGYRIGLCGFDNSLRDAKTEEIKKKIGNGLKIKIDDDGSIMIKRISRSNVYLRDPDSRKNSFSSLPSTGSLLEMEKPSKLFDMKLFVTSIERELGKTCPDVRRLENECISVVTFVEDSADILDCCCWILIINIVALDLLRSKVALLTISRNELIPRHTQFRETDFRRQSISTLNLKTKFINPKAPKQYSKEVARLSLPEPDYDGLKLGYLVGRSPRQTECKDYVNSNTRTGVLIFENKTTNTNEMRYDTVFGNCCSLSTCTGNGSQGCKKLRRSTRSSVLPKLNYDLSTL